MRRVICMRMVDKGCLGGPGIKRSRARFGTDRVTTTGRVNGVSMGDGQTAGVLVV